MSKPEDKKKLVEGHGQSGMGVSEYCRKVGLSEHQYYYWRRRIEGERGRNPEAGRFVEISCDGQRMVEVALDGGIVIRTPVENLKAVLREVRCVG